MCNNHPHHKSWQNPCPQEAALGGKSVPEGLRTGRPQGSRESLRAQWAWVMRQLMLEHFHALWQWGRLRRDFHTVHPGTRETKEEKGQTHLGEGHRARAFQTSQKLCSHFFFFNKTWKQQKWKTCEIIESWPTSPPLNLGKGIYLKMNNSKVSKSNSILNYKIKKRISSQISSTQWKPLRTCIHKTDETVTLSFQNKLPFSLLIKKLIN